MPLDIKEYLYSFAYIPQPPKNLTNMKKQIFFSLLGSLFLIVACSEKQSSNAYTVEGSIDDSTFNGTTIYMLDYDTQKNVDSTFVTDGKFVFKGTVDTTKFCRISAGRKYSNLILEGGDIKINFEKPNNPEGTAMNQKLSQYFNTADSMNTIIRSEYDKIKEVEGRTPEEITKLREDYYENTWKPVFVTTMKGIFEANSNNLIGMLALQNLDGVLNPDQLEELSGKSGEFVLSRNIVKRMLVRLKALKLTAEGMQFTDFTIEDDNGNKLSLSDYVGKGNYVLVDFWASWCGPCRGETPNIKEIYNKYKNKNFNVLSVAVWDKPENTRKAIEEDKLEWPQIVNAQEVPTKLYGINGIPHIILFGPDGKIVARDLRGDAMKAKIAEVMN